MNMEADEHFGADDAVIMVGNQTAPPQGLFTAAVWLLRASLKKSKKTSALTFYQRGGCIAAARGIALCTDDRRDAKRLYTQILQQMGIDGEGEHFLWGTLTKDQRKPTPLWSVNEDALSQLNKEGKEFLAVEDMFAAFTQATHALAKKVGTSNLSTEIVNKELNDKFSLPRLDVVYFFTNFNQRLTNFLREQRDEYPLRFRDHMAREDGIFSQEKLDSVLEWIEERAQVAPSKVPPPHIPPPRAQPDLGNAMYRESRKKTAYGLAEIAVEKAKHDVHGDQRSGDASAAQVDKLQELLYHGLSSERQRAKERDERDRQRDERESKNMDMLTAAVGTVNSGLGELTATVNSVFKQHNRRLDQHDQRHDQHDQRLDQHGQRHDQHDQRLDQHGQRHNQHDQRHDQHGQRLDQQGQQIGTLTKQVTTLTKMCKSLSERSMNGDMQDAVPGVALGQMPPSPSPFPATAPAQSSPQTATDFQSMGPEELLVIVDSLPKRSMSDKSIIELLVALDEYGEIDAGHRSGMKVERLRKVAAALERLLIPEKLDISPPNGRTKKVLVSFIKGVIAQWREPNLEDPKESDQKPAARSDAMAPSTLFSNDSPGMLPVDENIGAGNEGPTKAETGTASHSKMFAEKSSSYVNVGPGNQGHTLDKKAEAETAAGNHSKVLAGDHCGVDITKTLDDKTTTRSAGSTTGIPQVSGIDKRTPASALPRVRSSHSHSKPRYKQVPTSTSTLGTPRIGISSDGGKPPTFPSSKTSKGDSSSNNKKRNASDSVEKHSSKKNKTIFTEEDVKYKLRCVVGSTRMSKLKIADTQELLQACMDWGFIQIRDGKLVYKKVVTKERLGALAYSLGLAGASDAEVSTFEQKLIDYITNGMS